MIKKIASQPQKQWIEKQDLEGGQQHNLIYFNLSLKDMALIGKRYMNISSSGA
jgi:hypothetical protein